MSDIFSLISSGVKIRMEYDIGQNAIFIGEAPPGTDEGDDNWRIKQLIYDGDNNLVQINWANKESVSFTVNWDDRATYNYS